jgi:DNA-binding CsgD family transcriptional regulator
VMTTWSPATKSGRVEGKFGLTPLELEIVASVVGGYSCDEIAQKLSISRRAVVQELTTVSHKLGVEGHLELALFAIHHGLLADQEVF